MPDLIHGALLAGIAAMLALQLRERRARRNFQEDTMASIETFTDLLTAVDAETTRIADTVQELLARIAAGGMSADEEEQVRALLAAQLDKLRAVGADPADPVPADPPTE